MKILIIGSGGREHALAWKLFQSPKVSKIFAAPGNAGMDAFCTRMLIPVTDVESLYHFAKNEKIDLTVVGPEDPLVSGIVNRFWENGLTIFGPDREGAKLEASKDLCRTVCFEAGVKTASGKTFTHFDTAKAYLQTHPLPVVIKADGLSQGKGVVIAETLEGAVLALKNAMLDKHFGTSGDTVVIEEFLRGYEVSILAVCSEMEAVLLDPAQDHKRIYDADQGPNTGGMGTYSPVPAFSAKQKKFVETNIILPVLKRMKERGTPYRGVLFAGLMVCAEDDIRVLEFNVRFGDPETQAVLPRLQGDLFDLLEAAAKGQSLRAIPISWTPEACVCVVAVSGGYPGSYRKGFLIQGTDQTLEPGSFLFHAGTEIKNNILVTQGGRVLGVSSLGQTMKDAKEKSYRTLSHIHFENIFYRKDISDKAQ